MGGFRPFLKERGPVRCGKLTCCPRGRDNGSVQIRSPPGGPIDPAPRAVDSSMQELPTNPLWTIQEELRVPAATAQLARFDLPEPMDHAPRPVEAYRFDLCLTQRPKNARACYSDSWSPRRFERIGNVFVRPPGESLKVRSDSGTSRSVVFWLSPELVHASFERHPQWTRQRLELSLDIGNANMRSLLFRLADELRHPGFASKVLVELLAGQLAIELARCCATLSECPVRGGLEPWQLRLIDERLMEIREAPTLVELAELCRLSVRQLSRRFRVSRGGSIGGHVASLRIHHAKELLATDRSIKSIAHLLGFSSPSAFAFAFRRATGEAPRGFRKRLLPAG